MGRIVVPRPPDQKPPLGTSLNRSHPLARELVGCWVMNEGGGLLYNNLAGSDNDGVVVGTSVDRIADFVEFSGDGNNDRIDLGSVSSTNPLSCVVNGEITVFAKFWVNSGILSNLYPRIFDKSNGGSGANGYALVYNDDIDIMACSVNGTDVVFNSDVPARDTWVTAAFTFKDTSNEWNCYIDGVLDRTTTSAAAISSTTTNAAIGNWNHSTDRNWDGYISFVYVWNRVLASSEVALIHREPYCMFEQPTIWSVPETVTRARIIVPRPPDQKPPLGTLLNRSHPLVRWLVRCFVLNELGGGQFWDALHLAFPATTYNSPVWADGGLDFEMGSTQYARFDNRFTQGLSQSEYTIAVGLRLESINAADQQTFYSCWGSASGNREFILNISQNASTLEFDGSVPVTSNTSLTVGKKHNAAFTYRATGGDDDVQIFIDGLLDKESSDAQYNQISDVDGCIGARWTGSAANQPFDGIIYYVYVFNRVLLPAEIQRLHREPYCMFQQPEIWVTVEDAAVELTVSDISSATTLGSPTILSRLVGSVCWGHDTAVAEDNVVNFSPEWTGTGSITGSGDAEKIWLNVNEYMDSEPFELGAGTCTLDDDKYGTTRGTRTLQYKTGTTKANCEADTWHDYSTPFATSGEGWVQIRVKNP